MHHAPSGTPIGRLARRLPATALAAVFLLLTLGRSLAFCLDAGCGAGAPAGVPCEASPFPFEGSGECAACTRDAGCGREVLDGDERVNSRARRVLNGPPGAMAGPAPASLPAPPSWVPRPDGAAPLRSTPFSLLSAPLRC